MEGSDLNKIIDRYSDMLCKERQQNIAFALIMVNVETGEHIHTSNIEADGQIHIFETAIEKVREMVPEAVIN